MSEKDNQGPDATTGSDMAAASGAPSTETAASEVPAKIRLWPAMVIVLLAAALLTALYTVPYDDSIQGWHRVVWGWAVMLGSGVALLVWLLRGSRIAWPTKRRILYVSGILIAILLATVRIRGYGGDMELLLAPRSWVVSCLSLVTGSGDVFDDKLAEMSDQEKSLRQLATRGDRANDVYEFLGPGRKPEFDVRLDPDWKANPPEQLWRRPAGEGFSGFVVKGHLAITQLQRLEGEDQGEAIVCVDLETGQSLWRHSDDVHFTSGLGGNGPRATPTIDGDYVYAMGATGLLNCLNLYTGEVVWARSVMEDNRASPPMWAMSGSPLIVDNAVVVSGGDQDKAGDAHALLLAYDKETGEPLWQGLGMDNGSYGSPELATVAGVRQIMIFTATQIVGHDATSGEQLWSYPWPGDMPNVAQVVKLDENRVFASKGYATGSVVLDLSQIDDKRVPKEVWRERALMKTKFTNAVFRDGYAYGLSDGRLECIDVENHRRKWKVRADYGQGQVLLAGDHLLIQAESGDVALVNVNPEEHEEVARFSPLSDRTWNYPLLVGDLLLVRNDLEMACYRLKQAE